MRGLSLGRGDGVPCGWSVVNGIYDGTYGIHTASETHFVVSQTKA